MDNIFTREFHGLKGWQWIAVIGGGAFVYFRYVRGGVTGSSGTSATDTSGNTDPTAGAQGFGQGYEQGYGQGVYQGSIAPVPVANPPAGSQNCRTMKDPAGHSHTVCGNGAFVRLPGTSAYRWVEGATKTIYGYGKRGNPFYTLAGYRRATAAKAHAPVRRHPLKGAGSGSLPRR